MNLLERLREHERDIVSLALPFDAIARLYLTDLSLRDQDLAIRFAALGFVVIEDGWVRLTSLGRYAR